MALRGGWAPLAGSLRSPSLDLGTGRSPGQGSKYLMVMPHTHVVQNLILNDICVHYELCGRIKSCGLRIMLWLVDFPLLC